ncbi:hypothetical protein GCM10011416_06920 [Polaribacter pacificus]|uniref:Uncharacterized protein n=1 Tax=Polaribacter pacificus TaxID=1775173 RepID=A0A917MCF9_9FLAO|nr:hypothetical protein [Polaribacter pacificus]GGG92610.1 hypothetical protein GCM10011416_06920 [Polaribacter pacificus]
MKKVIAVVLVLTLSVTTVFANNEQPNLTGKEQLRSEIVKLLGQHQLKISESFVKAEISFLINRQGELVILSVDSENQTVVGFIKKQLNYKKLSIKELSIMKTFKMPLKIVKN